MRCERTRQAGVPWNQIADLLSQAGAKNKVCDPEELLRFTSRKFRCCNIYYFLCRQIYLAFPPNSIHALFALHLDSLVAVRLRRTASAIYDFSGHAQYLIIASAAGASQ